MAESRYPEVTGADIEAVGEQLKRLHAQASPGERLVMEWLLTRAAQASADAPMHKFNVSPGLSAFKFSDALGLTASKYDAGSKFAFKYAPPK
jgi:hypothetical protein